MEYYCLTNSHEIGASCHALTCDDETIVVDSGLHPKMVGYDAMPPHQLLDGQNVTSIALTHSHLDHVGTIPVLQNKFPEASLYLTEPTFDLADAMLHNSVNVMTSQRVELDIPEYPLFTHDQIDQIQKQWKPRRYNRFFDVSKNVTMKFQDAGHVMGSCTVSVFYDNKKVLFTGDVQTEDQTLIKGADVREEGDYDALVMETTRGAAPRPEGFTRQKEELRFAQAIADGVKRGGAVLIPVFAMGKTQEVLTMISKYKKKGVIPDAPVHVGGLSTKMTTIYDRHARRTRRKVPKFQILKDMKLKVARRGKRAPLQCRPGQIYCLSSGMMTENTVSNVFARAFLDNPKNSLLFVGYADPESPAGKIKVAQHGDKITLDERTPPIALLSSVECFDFSGHAPREDILKLAIGSGAKKIFLTHGDTDAREWFRQQLSEKMPESEIIIPEPGEKYAI